MNDLTCSNDNEIIKIKILTMDNVEQLYSLIDSSREDLKNLVWSQNATLESTKIFIQNKTQAEDQVHGIFQNNELLGVLELRKKEGNMFELGYWLGTQYRGQHIMQCAVKTLVEHTIHTHNVVAHIRKTNVASYKVLSYAGLLYDHTEVWEGEKWIHLKRHQLKPQLKMKS